LQAQLEAEIENLSWKIERVETTERDRGDIENQMDISEKRRMILLKDFFPTTNISASSNYN
jgi:ariadne-2